VDGGDEIVNENYSVSSAEGVSASGPPVVTEVIKDFQGVYLPIIIKK
jgi:hypothetical protein